MRRSILSGDYQKDREIYLSHIIGAKINKTAGGNRLKGATL